jgi:hypothetical protein
LPPDNRKRVLKEELEAAGADKDAELLKQAQALVELLEKNGAGELTRPRTDEAAMKLSFA